MASSETKDFKKALSVGRPPNVAKLFPNSRALLVSGKVIDRAMIAKGKAMTIAANARNVFTIPGVLKAAQRANAAVIIEIAKSEGGAGAYCAVSSWNLATFVDAWANVRLKESAAYVTHFDDLCTLVGHPKPAHMDKTGETFTYQKGAQKEQAGEIVGNGFADVWFKDHFAVEYKTARQHKTLAEAFKQLQQYGGALENPPLLVVCDFERYEVHANFNGAVSKVYRFTNADIASDKDIPGSKFNAYQILHHLFFEPEALRPDKTMMSVTEEAGRKFAELSASIHKKNPKLEPLQVARFLVKIVFCLFCEDVGLLPKELFAEIVERTMGNEGKFTRNLRDLARLEPAPH